MAPTALTVDHIARIEGHGNVHVVIDAGKVASVEFQVTEPARLFESMVVGRSFDEIPFIASRVCGICSPSHAITSIKTIEKIFEVEVSARTHALRELLIYGSFIQNHATHLFVLAAPDYLNTSTVFPLAQTDPALLEKALSLKALGNELCNLIGGRSIHPITAVVGGFTQEIKPDDYRALSEKLTEMVPFALASVDLFNSFTTPDLTTDGDMLMLVEEDYYPVETSQKLKLLSDETPFDVAEVFDHVEEYTNNHSGALFSRTVHERKPYLTAALARVNASWNYLCSDARVAAAKAALRPPVTNPFRNNVAQAIELIDALERCAHICEMLATDEIEGVSTPIEFEVKAGHAIACTEAPRGVLIHALDIDSQGKVLQANIVTPTAQNLANLEADIRKLTESLCAEHVEEHAIKSEITKLIRAYDPCLSCSVH